MPFSPLAIANTFIAEHAAESGGISHMKLQKLVFYAYGWWLASHDDQLTTEPPEVWKFGPVFNSLYGELAPFGMQPIKAPRRSVPYNPAPQVPADACEVRDLLEWVWQKYGNYTAGQLSDMTHDAGTPWQEEAAKHQYRVPRNHPIPIDRTQAYFKALAQKMSGDVV